MEKKSDGSWRCCGNYHRLNKVTVPDTYPLPNMMDFSSRVAGCLIFTNIVLRKGYYQIPMHPHHHAVWSLRVPAPHLGAVHRQQHLQRLMDQVLAGLTISS
jgi:hypothetical protein